MRLLSFGWSIFKQIGGLAKSSEYGFTTDLPPYDLIIQKTGEGLETEYQVQASRKEVELSEMEQKAVENLRLVTEIIQKMKENNPGKTIKKT